MIGHAEAADVIILPPQRLGHEHRKPAPSGQQADAALISMCCMLRTT